MEKALPNAAFILGFGLLVTPLVAASLSEPAPDRAAPSFFFGEHLVYDISWAGISVGEGDLQTEPGDTFNGREVFRLVSKATSNDWLSFFYPVSDRVESIVDANGLYPYKITVKQRHGFRKRDREIRFNQDAHTAVMLYKGKTYHYTVPSQVQDILSSFYYFRTIPDLLPGRSVFIDVHEGKKNYKLEVQILSHETLETVIGRVPTIKVKALARYEGLLMNKGDLYVWLTDDARRIPVLMNGKVSIGSITATLSRLDPPRLLQAP